MYKNNDNLTFPFPLLVKSDYISNGLQMGLTFDSLIVLDRIAQFKKIRLVGCIGTCPESVIEKIEELLHKMKDDGVIV
jgi:hypothetical protein